MHQFVQKRCHKLLRALKLFVLTLPLAASNCPQGQSLNTTPAFVLAFRGTDGMLHVRWSSDGMTWVNPDTFPPSPSLDTGPGLGGIPGGLSQMLVFKHATSLLWLSGLGPAEYGGSPPELLETGATVDSGVSVAFTGSGHWLIAHRSGNNGVLKLWDGANPPVIVTPPGAMLGLCQPDGFSGPIGPQLMVLNNLALVGFCQRDASGTESIQLLPGTINPQGIPSFSAQVAFPTQTAGFQAPDPKVFALAHDGTNFLLANVAPDLSQPGPLTTFGLIIKGSADGQNWNFVSQTSTASGLHLSARSTPLGMAAMPPRNGHPAFIEVAQHASSTQSPRLWAFDGANWSDLSNANAFGGTAADPGQSFAFRVNGQP
jgi:hypothetical protein